MPEQWIGYIIIRYQNDERIVAIEAYGNKYNELLNSNELKEIFDNGMKKTNEIAKKKYEELKQLVGLQR